MADPIVELRDVVTAIAPAPPEMDTYLEKVRDRAYAVVDHDIAALKEMGFSEEAIFEQTVAGAVASYALGEEVWNAVVADWRTAPLRSELRAALAFIEVLTLRPDELTEADALAAYDAGVSREALRDAATVCALFNMITRVADSLGWDVPSSDRLTARAPAMLEGGYSFAAMRQR